MRDFAADATAILHAAIAASDPAGPVHHALGAAPELTDAAAVHAIAVGKAACRMMQAATSALHNRVRTQLTIVPHDVTCDDALHAAHPIPDQTSVDAAAAVVAAIHRAPLAEPVLVLLSGGASALIAQPAAHITVGEYADCVRLLTRAGASIGELNTLRKHIDTLKGGRLAALAAPRRVLGLLLSDVVGDPVDVIASGPLSPDPSTFADAIAVLHHYRLWQECAPSIRAALLPLRGRAPVETPKQPSDIANARTVVVGNNALARSGAAEKARALGYQVIELVAPVTGEARAAARQLAGYARDLLQEVNATPLCIIAGGETTVTVRGNGRGGRNQELALAAALEVEDLPAITIGSVGTDGIDGDSDAAGAVASAQLLGLARSRGVQPERYLENNDSYGFFSRAGGHIITGATGTNVMDVQVFLLNPG